AKVTAWLLQSAHGDSAANWSQFFRVNRNVPDTNYLLEGTYRDGLLFPNTNTSNTIWVHNDGFRQYLGFFQGQSLSPYLSLDYATPANAIDPYVQTRLFLLNPVYTDGNDDATFLRRIMLDLFGVAPTTLELQYFLADKDPKKRTKVVEWLTQTVAAQQWPIV